MSLVLPEITRNVSMDKAGPVMPNFRPVVDTVIPAAFESMSESFTAVGELFKKRENERQYEEAVTQFGVQSAKFAADYKGMPEYDVEQMSTDPLFLKARENLKISESETVIPSHLIYAEWKRLKEGALLDETAKIIGDPALQRAFRNDTQVKIAAGVASETVNARGDQIRYNATKTATNVTNALAVKNYSLAHTVINNANVPDYDKAKLHDTVTKQQQEDTWNGAMNTEDIGRLMEVKKLVDAGEKAGFSHISEAQRLSWSEHIATKIHTITSRLKAEDSAQLKQDKHDASMLAQSLNNFDYVSPQLIENTARRLPEDSIERVDFLTSVNTNNVGRIVFSQPLNTWDQSLQNLKAAIDTMPDSEKTKKISTLKTYDALVSGMEAAKAELKKDPLSWGEKIGIIKLPELDFNDIGASFAARKKAVQTMVDNYGAYDGFMKSAELMEFTTRIDNMPPDRRIATIKNINDNLGDFSEPFYKTIQQKHIGKTWTAAAMITTYGPEGYKIAEEAFKGEKELAENDTTKAYMTEIEDKKIAQYLADNGLGQMFRTNTNVQNSYRAAIRSVYAYRKDGDVERAFNDVMGGTIQWNDHTIQAPITGIQPEQYVKYVKELPDSWWQQQKVYGMSWSDLKRGMLEGQLYQVTEGRGVSTVFRKDSSEQVLTPDRKAYVFKFDPEMFKYIMASTKKERVITNKENISRTPIPDVMMINP